MVRNTFKNCKVLIIYPSRNCGVVVRYHSSKCRVVVRYPYRNGWTDRRMDGSGSILLCANMDTKLSCRFHFDWPSFLKRLSLCIILFTCDKKINFQCNMRIVKCLSCFICFQSFSNVWSIIAVAQIQCQVQPVRHYWWLEQQNTKQFINTCIWSDKIANRWPLLVYWEAEYQTVEKRLCLEW